MGTTKSLKFLIILIMSVFIIHHNLIAGTTGKLTGRVVDKQSGEPLPGANVIIEGTTLGAACDLDGKYIIMMIAPGIYTVRAEMMGYKSTRYENVKISIDLTTKQDFQLETTVLEMGEEVTIVAERPMVQMDLTSSEAVIGSETIARLPVDHFEDVVNLQAGVVDGHFRGGRRGEVMYMINGLPVNDVYSGSYAFQVENNAIAELEVISGTFNAEYGQAMSGVVNIVTKEGGDKYNGEISAYLGNYFSNNKDVFWNIDKFNPTYNFEASLSGPLPLLNNKLNFYITGRWFDKEGYIYGKDVFEPSDQSDFIASDMDEWTIMSHGETYQFSKQLAQQLIAEAKPVPMAPSRRINTMLKLTYKLTASDKLNYELLWQDMSHKNYDHRFRLNPNGDYQRVTSGYNNSLIWTHMLNERAFFTLKINNFLNTYKQYVYEDPYDPRYVPVRRLQDSGANAFLTGGMQMWNFQRSTNTTTGKFDLTAQISNAHQVKFGVEAKRHKLWLHEFEVVPDSKRRIPAPTSFNNNQYTHYPKDFAVYIQDKMEFDYMIVNAGIRFDYFNPDGELPTDFTNPTTSPRETATTSTQFSPRFGLAYPISSKGVIHVSYGHFFQIPNLDYLYVNPDFELYLLQSTVSPPPNSTLNILGNASLNPQKTVIYEIGLQQQLSDNFALNATAYRKDIRNLLSTEVLLLYTGGYYSRYINRDYANVKGITVSLEKRQTEGIIGVGASVDYTFQVAKGNASDPNDTFLNAQAGKETLKQMRPLDWDRRHQINATLSFGRAADYNISVIGRVATGFPYTSVYGSGAYIENNSRKPLFLSFDLYYYKIFKIAGLRYTGFVRVFNVFDRLNELEVFPDTGRAGYSLTPFHQSYLHPRGINELEDYFVRPDFYSAPREVQVGVSIEF
ncbi:MAG: TonB-dependent receptor [bacterium]|nr:TonB-dependent receptor [bacterium]